MTKKATKRALLFSVLSLVLCMSMFVGTTFAWFTDSVTSANNVIQSGNLDIDVEYTLDGTNWDYLDGAEDLFQKGLWEPGHTEVVALKITNKGSLALKYSAFMNIIDEVVGKTKDGKDIVLSDILTVSTICKATDADVAPAFSGENAVAYENTASFRAGNVLGTGKYLLAGETNYIVVKVDMAETVGNEANHNGVNIPAITFGVNVVATQYTYESDSFGDQYDVAAPWTGFIPDEIPASLVIDVGEDAKDQTGTITIKSPEALAYLNKLAKEWVSLYSNGQGTDIEKYYISNGGKGTDYYYHYQWKVVLDADLDMSNIPMDAIPLSYWGSFDGNGHTISNIVLKNGVTSLFGGRGVIKNLSVENIVVNAASANMVGAILGNGGALTNVHVVNATVNGGKYVGGLAGKGSSFIDCSIKNSTVTGTDKTVGGLVGYSIGDPGTATVSGNTVENVIVTGTYNVGGLLGQSQNETVENNTIKNVTVKSTLELPAGASSNEVRTANVAARSNFAGTVIGANTVEDVTLIEVANVSDNAELNNAIASGKTELALGSGNYVVPGTASGKTLTIVGNGDTVIDITTVPTYAGLPGATLTFENVIIKSDEQGAGYNRGFAHTNKVTYNNCVINGTLGLNTDTEFNNCTFNISGDYYNLWTWGAPNVLLNGCTFNSDGKAVLLYGGVDTKLTVNNCVFNDNGGLTDLKAAIEIGNDYGKSYELIVNNTTVNGYEINDKGIVTGTTLWANKNSMAQDKLNVVVDGVDVY